MSSHGPPIHNLMVPRLTAFAVLMMLGGCARPQADAPDLTSLVAAAPTRADLVRALNDAARADGSPSQVAPSFRDANARVRFAAVYLASLWADTTADADVLRPLLKDPDDRIRAVVAGSLAGLGDAEAKKALEALAPSSASMPYSDPPLPVSEFVRSIISPPVARAVTPSRRSRRFSLSPFAVLEAASSLSTDAATITIKVPIDVIGGNDTLIALWEAGIDDAWNHGNAGGRFEICGRAVNFVPEFHRLPPEANTTRDSHAIVVEEVRPGQYYVSTVWHTAGTSPTESARTGFWGSNASPTTAAHEFGHLLGLDDEYKENDVNGNGVRDPGETTIPDRATYPSADRSAMGTYGGAVFQRHVEAAVAAHDVDGALKDCSQEVLIKGFYNAQPQNQFLCNGARATIEIRLTVKVLEWTAEGSGDATLSWRRHNPCANTLWGGATTQPGATASIKVIHDFSGRTNVTISGSDTTQSFLISGEPVADARPILPYWLDLVKGTNVQGTLASFVMPQGHWKAGARFSFENRAGDAKPLMMNYGSATLEVCRRSDEGPFKGCTLP